jgi:Fur family ferric uptake transcriptional regulator
VDLGLVRETCLGANRRFYEVEEDIPHHHLVCNTCGRVIHIHDEDLGGLAASLLAVEGFAAREVTAFGVCRPCRELETETAGTVI